MQVVFISIYSIMTRDRMTIFLLLQRGCVSLSSGPLYSKSKECGLRLDLCRWVVTITSYKELYEENLVANLVTIFNTLTARGVLTRPKKGCLWSVGRVYTPL